MGGLGLGELRARASVPRRVGAPVGQCAPHQNVDDRSVLGVDTAQRADLTRPFEHLEYRGVVDHQLARIGHEHLDTGDTLGDQLVDLAERTGCQVGDHDVLGVVDHGLALGGGQPVVDRGPKVLDRVAAGRS